MSLTRVVLEQVEQRLGQRTQRLDHGLLGRRSISGSALHGLRRLLGGGEDDARRHKLDNVRDVTRQVVLVGADVGVAGLDVVVGVESRGQEGFKLAHGAGELDPGVGARDGDLSGVDAGVDEPALDGVDVVALRGEELGDLLLGVVLAVVGRGGVGAASC